MKCRDCCNFKPDTGIEAASEISPNTGAIKGKCSINGRNCKMNDRCGCGGFSKK